MRSKLKRGFNYLFTFGLSKSPCIGSTVLFLQDLGFFNDVFTLFILLTLFKSSDVFPTEDTGTAAAHDVTDCVETSYEKSVFCRAEGDVDYI